MWPGIWNILDGWFFGPAAQGPRPRACSLRILGYPYAVIRDLLRGEVSLRAMGLVYATLLSTIPLLAFIFALLNRVGAYRDLRPVIFDFFRPIGPNAGEVTDQVLQFATSVSSGLVGGVGFALLLWTLLGATRKVEDSFNFIWHVEIRRSFPRRVAAHLGLLVIGPLLLIAFIALTKSVLDYADLSDVVGRSIAHRLDRLALEASRYLTVMAIFTVLYLLVPNTRVRFRPALFGAVAAGCVWAALGAAFTTLFVASARLMIVYAGFAIVVEALLWTYFGWLILLAGAQLSFYIQNPYYLRVGVTELRLSNRETERLALEVMYLVGRSHATPGSKWNEDSLATALALPGVLVVRVLRTLADAGLVVRGRDGDVDLVKDPDRISVHAILEAARTARTGQLSARELELPAIDQLIERLESCWGGCCGGESLGDLVQAHF
jgi:membrane protein